MHCGFSKRVLVAVIAVLWCGSATVDAQGPGTAACVVEMRGSRTSLSCSEGAITASAEASVKRQLQGSAAKAAVTWTDDKACGVEQGACMLSICGVKGNRHLNLQLVVANATGDPAKLWGIVCIAGNTKAVIQVGCQQTCRQLSAPAASGGAEAANETIGGCM